MKEMKAMFLILNLVMALFAFSYLVGAQGEVSEPTLPVLPSKTSSTPIPSGSPGGALNVNVAGGSARPAVDAASEASKGIGGFFSDGLLNNIAWILGFGVGGALLGSLLGGKNGYIWGAVSGIAGAITYQLAFNYFSSAGAASAGLKAAALGLGVGALIFILTFTQESRELVEFSCLPWEAPIGGKDCESCNELEHCSEYTCSSLGQACEIVNKGQEDQKCIWKNPNDVNSPQITFSKVNDGHKFTPDISVRPPASGVVITPTNGGCIPAFSPLEFTFLTDEPAQCKVDYNLTLGFNEMNYFVGGSNSFLNNHTEILSLPGPDTINAIAPELKNDGKYTLFVRCQDANGNFNQDAFSVNFCVEPGPDTTPPRIEDVSIPSGSPISFNQTSLNLEVYINEPSECKWSRVDGSYENMNNQMDCDTNLWEINSRNQYTCRTTLTGIEDRKKNDYFFKCRDQPSAIEGDRNTNTQSYKYSILGTQPLNILGVKPKINSKVEGATDTIPVFLELKTDNGANKGEAVCYYSINEPENDEDYIQFHETRSNVHKQRQDLVSGDYDYFFKCVDAGGNVDVNRTSFEVESDRKAPVVVRAYREGGSLKIITNEKSECSYSPQNCNFEITDGISMITSGNVHTAEWRVNQNYHIRCADQYNNQPNPNSCLLIVRPSQLGEGF